MKTARKRGIVVGFDYYGRYLCRLINEYSTNWELTFYGATRMDTIRASLALRNADALISFGGPSPNVALVEGARLRGVRIVVIWAGSDVITARRDPQLLEVIKRYGMTNISDAPWLVDELRELRIDAAYVPVTAIVPAPEIAPLPKSFTVLSYLPDTRRQFYGEKRVYALAREFPHVPFFIVGKGERNPVAPPNVAFLGHVDDMPARLDRSSVLLRLPEHDGKSMLVLETLARGRHVVWNYEFPHVNVARSETEAAAALRSLLEQHERGTLDVNRAGRAFVAETFARPQLAASFERVLDEARGCAIPTDERRIAISGLTLFVAHVAQRLQEHRVGWSPNVLRTFSRLEVVTAAVTLARSDAWYSIGSPIGDRWLHYLAQLLRKPRIVHWVGSDISALRSDARMQRLCSGANVFHLAEVEWTQRELREFGIDANIAPLPPRLPAAKIEPLPERFTILLYVPRARDEFYGRKQYERLIRAFGPRGVRFIVVGGGECYAPPGVDVRNLGWRTSLEDVYEDTSALIRFTKHDGLSLMVLEALSHGRQVLWTHDFPFTRRVESYHDIERVVEELFSRHQRGELRPQSDAATFVTREYDRDECIARIARSWDRATGGSHPTYFATETQ